MNYWKLDNKSDSAFGSFKGWIEIENILRLEILLYDNIRFFNAMQ